METKPDYQSTTKAFLSRPFCAPVPTETWIAAMLEAQTRALEEIGGMNDTWARVELFWLTYNFEFRQQIERWTKDNANLET